MQSYWLHGEQRRGRQTLSLRGKIQGETDVYDNEENEQEEVGDEVEEVVDKEDYSIALHDNKTAVNENDRLQIPGDFKL